MKTTSLALRNLTRNKRRNAILAIAIAFGFFVVTAIDGLTTGMVGSMEKQIAELFGGNVLVQGLEWLKPETPEGKAKIVNIVRDRDYVKNIADELNINYDYYSRYTMSAGSVIFNGKKSTIQLYGRDLNEKNLKNSMQFISGGIDSNITNGLIISDKTAETLNVQVGDELIYSTWTVYGQNTFADMVITGIVKSNGIISTLQAYTDIDDLNKIIEMPEGGYSVFALHLSNHDQQTKVANRIEARIRKDGENNPEINVTSRVLAMKTNPTNIGKGIERQLDTRKPENEWTGVKYGVETLYDELPQIKTILRTVHLVTTIILIVMLVIVMVGVANTYRMVLYERIREIGTMRALGMSGKDTRKVFTSEAVILCVIGAITGLLFAVIVMAIVHLIPISSDLLSFFLEKGHLVFKLTPLSIILQYIILIALTAFAVRGSAKQAARMSPAEALRTVK